MDASQPAGEGGASGAPRLEVGGELTFDRSVFSTIAARELHDIGHVALIAGDLETGFLGRLMTGGPHHPGITVEERGRTVVFHIEVVARDGVNFYDLGLDIQRRIAESVRRMTTRSCVVNVNVRGTSP
ncbi:MAG: Asp23/Gls24 family envelope stress response protein [Planctomycetota bacterium]|jgi:uncharacterized alkaline shock family protein YloU